MIDFVKNNLVYPCLCRVAEDLKSLIGKTPKGSPPMCRGRRGGTATQLFFFLKVSQAHGSLG